MAGVPRHATLPNIEQMFYRSSSDGPPPRPRRRPCLPPGALGRGSSAAGDGGVRCARGGPQPDRELADHPATADNGAPSRRSSGAAPVARHRDAAPCRGASLPTCPRRDRPDDPDGLSRARRAPRRRRPPASRDRRARGGGLQRRDDARAPGPRRGPGGGCARRLGGSPARARPRRGGRPRRSPRVARGPGPGPPGRGARDGRHAAPGARGGHPGAGPGDGTRGTAGIDHAGNPHDPGPSRPAPTHPRRPAGPPGLVRPAGRCAPSRPRADRDPRAAPGGARRGCRPASRASEEWLGPAGSRGGGAADGGPRREGPPRGAGPADHAPDPLRGGWAARPLPGPRRAPGGGARRGGAARHPPAGRRHLP